MQTLQKYFGAFREHLIFFPSNIEMRIANSVPDDAPFFVKDYFDYYTETSLDKDLEALEQSVNEYKKAKAEMQRLGFTDYDE